MNYIALVRLNGIPFRDRDGTHDVDAIDEAVELYLSNYQSVDEVELIPRWDELAVTLLCLHPESDEDLSEADRDWATMQFHNETEKRLNAWMLSGKKSAPSVQLIWWNKSGE